MPVHRGIFFRVLAEKQNKELATPAGYDWRPIDEQIIMRDPIFNAKDRRVKARGRLIDGHKCYGFLDQAGAVAYYMWITIARDAPRFIPWELHTQFALKPQTGYFWDCFTAPEHRRRGLYRTALRTAIKLTSNQDIENSYIYCLQENTPSLAAIRSAGFQDWFKFTVWRMGPLVFCKRSGRRALIKFGSPKFDILN